MQRFQTALRNKNVWQRAAVFDVHHAGAAARREASMAMSARSFSSLPDHEVISAGDVVCEVETDKAVVDYEATDDSYLAKILVQAGSGEIAVGQPIFVTVMEEEDVAAFKDFSADAAPAVEAAPATPAVEAAPAAAAPATPAPAASTPAAAPASGRVFASPLAKKAAAPAAAPAATPTATANYTDYPISPEAQAIAQQFTQQKLDVPHYHLSTNLTLDKLLDARARLNAGRGEDEQLSVNDFIVRAASLAMRKVPDANSSWKGSFIRQFKDVNVNLMVSTSAGGVVAPVLNQVNRKGLDDISKETQVAVAKANDGEFEPADLANGTFTISNVGQFDVQSLAGIVRPDQACLLGLGTIEKKVVPNDDPNAEQIYKYAQVMTATLACDHRVIDGAVGAQWLASFKELVEDPLKMIL
ncbi:Dihydrolipoyllysine-residue acetyltransferase component 3 of pyruvate dehydrogenase complex [Phytophthora nicotianae]|uniref:Dihydrolipoamide acetyltransferase component of pyruvate dehydrogenase complex n=1 Tax=Phytophthora nicotianae TaxID=4792 RepID=A0A0W8DT71_PHYNI|nr:Dihydrolipoyllysine-residue acetyltransferase component 3 of pyruvate dehydrogenase complex [Phytophthora nicotianae]